MKFRTGIIIYATIPIIISFIATIFSQYIALNYSKTMISDYADRLFETQLTFVKLITVCINQQIQHEIQKYAVMMYTINSFQSSIINGLVIPNPKSKFSNLNMELLYDNKEDPDLTKTFLKNKHATNIWFQQNTTEANQLSLIGQNEIKNISYGNLLSRTYQYIYDNQGKDNSLYLKIDKIVSGFSADGLYYSSGQNTTFRYSSPANCNKGKFDVDIRCLSWFKSGQNQQSLYALPPFYSSINNNKALSSGLCQPLINFNNTKQKDEIYMISCVPLYLDKFQMYFQNFINQTKQSYLIEPRTQSIVYNSQQVGKQNAIQYFSNVELSNNTNQEYAQSLNNTIIKNYTFWVYDVLNQTDLKKLTDTQINLITQLQYIKNNQNYTAIINPIILIDKLPNYKGVKSPQQQGFRQEILYLQINFLSDEDLRAQANELQKQVNLYLTIVGIVLLIFFVFAVILIIHYTKKLNQLVEIPIDHLIGILKQMLQEIKSQEIFKIYNNFKQNSDDKFLSKETLELFKSFEQIFQFLIQSSENFFSQDKSEVLLNLYKKIEFFKQFKNNYALGIIHNNIGSILLSQDHFFQALEHFSMAILYAQYEIQELIQNNDRLRINCDLTLFYFNDSKIIGFEQKNQEQKGSISSLSLPQKVSQDKFFIHKKEKSQNKSKISFQLNKINRCTSTYYKYTIQEYLNNIQLQNQPTTNIGNQQQGNSQENSMFFQQENEIIHQHKKESQRKDTLSFDQKKQQQQQLNSSNLSLFNKKNNPQISSHLQEQLIHLLKNVYFRKKNYALALVSFQENYDKILNQKKQMHLKSYNFWPQIKKIFKELFVMAQQLEANFSERIELLTFISKCYLNQGKFSSSKICLNQCNQIFNNNYQNMHQKETREKMQASENLKNITLNQAKTESQQKNEKMLKSNIQKIIFSSDKCSASNLKSNKENTSQISKINQQNNQKSFSEKTQINSKQNTSLCARLYKYFFLKRNLNQQVREDSIQLQTNNITNHQKSEDENNLETIFESLRNKQNIKEYKNIQQLVSQTINLAIVDYLIDIKQFQKAGNILVELFEKNYYLYSHFPAQIVIKTNKIFKMSKIKNQDFDTFVEKFNKNIQMQVCFAVDDLKRNHNYYFETLNLFSNLLKSSLIKQKDEAGFLFYNKNEKSVQNILEMVEVNLSKNQIQNMIQYIFFNLMQTYYMQNYQQQNQLSQSFKKYQHNQNQGIKNQSNSNLINIGSKNQSKSQLYSFSQIAEQPKELEEIENLKRKRDLFHQREYLNIQDREDFHPFSIQSIQHSPLIREKIEDEEEHNQKNYREENEQSIQNLIKFSNNQQNNKNESSSHQLNSTQFLDLSLHKHNYKFNNLGLSQQQFKQRGLNLIQSQIKFLSDEDLNFKNEKIERLLDENKFSCGINFFNNQNISFKTPQNFGDDNDQTTNDYSFDLEESQINYEKNFHFLIRRAILQLTSNIQQQFKNKFKQTKQEDDFLEYMEEIKDLNIEKKSKFLIFVTEQILMQKNLLFHKLCNCLFQLEITLVILSFKLGNNFLEKNDQGTHFYKNKEIIKIFYSIASIQNYLNNQRFSITQNIYPTYVQHF